MRRVNVDSRVRRASALRDVRVRSIESATHRNIKGAHCRSRRRRAAHRCASGSRKRRTSIAMSARSVIARYAQRQQ